ncbi:unnamed protein product [Clonostachys byssicola]|uniref:Uncharacterized protein n=1 Tax=Clonostachys byssicola TaxID=160290 RepID=A0A9N9UCB6_9HYPO|nr:unnamed protein product [Clonostachys byssicola]
MASKDPPHTPPPDSFLYRLRKKTAMPSLRDAAKLFTKPDVGAPTEEPDATASLADSDAERVSHGESDTAQRTREDSDRFDGLRNELAPSPKHRERLYVSKEEFTLEELKVAMKPFFGGDVEILNAEYRLTAIERFRMQGYPEC